MRAELRALAPPLQLDFGAQLLEAREKRREESCARDATLHFLRAARATRTSTSLPHFFARSLATRRARAVCKPTPLSHSRCPEARTQPLAEASGAVQQCRLSTDFRSPFARASRSFCSVGSARACTPAYRPSSGRHSSEACVALVLLNWL